MKRNRYFQWLDGDLKGTVSTLDNITCVEDEYFYNFTDGESCNLRFISKMTKSPGDLKGKVMVEVANPNDLWTSEEIKMKKEIYMDPTAGEQMVDVPPLEDIAGKSTTGNGQNLNVTQSALGTMKYKAPKYNGPMTELPSLDDYLYDENFAAHRVEFSWETTDGNSSKLYTEDELDKKIKEATEEAIRKIENAKIPQSTQPEPVSTIDNFTSGLDENDPVRLLAKTCKKHSTPVEMTININLPSKSIYTIANDEFEDGGKKFIECLVETINVEDIKYAIRDALIAAYSESDDSINQ